MCKRALGGGPEHRNGSALRSNEEWLEAEVNGALVLVCGPSCAERHDAPPGGLWCVRHAGWWLRRRAA